VSSISHVRNQPQSDAGLAIEAALQDGAFVVEGASYFADSKMATESSADADWKRRSLYLGPQVSLGQRRHLVR
jgi:complement component 1 Q subcomponent-binding protein